MNSRDLYKSLNNLFQKIVVLQKHLNNEINLGSIMLPIVNEETNNLQSYWEVTICIFILLSVKDFCRIINLK